MFSTRLHRAYPSDLTDAQWALLAPFIPPLSPEAAYYKHERREIITAILYVLRSGCPWRMLPRDFPAWGTVYDYFRRWQRQGVWDRVLEALRMQMRTKAGRDAQPSAAVIDSQSVKTSAVRGEDERLRQREKNLGTQTPPVSRYAGPSDAGQSDRDPSLRSRRGVVDAQALESRLSPHEAAVGR